MLSIYIDGAARGNPGEAGIGIIIKKTDGTVLFSAAGYIGKTTNNAAEYTALLTALTKLKKSPTLLKSGSGSPDPGLITIYSDSELVVKQTGGQYRVKEPELKKLYGRVLDLIRSIPHKIEIKHIRREQNREADRLANLGIDSKLPLSI
jgi:ribonuclease HI